VHSLFVPILAGARADREAWNIARDRLERVTILISSLALLGYALAAPLVLPILFGAKFREDALFLGLVALLQTTRILFNWPTTLALAAGRTLTVLYANLLHAFGFVGALLGAAVVPGLTGLIAGFGAGELIAAALTIVLVNSSLGDGLFSHFGKFGDFGGVAAVTLATVALVTAPRGDMAIVLWAVALVGLGRLVWRRQWILQSGVELVATVRSHGLFPAAVRRS
jgi:O-antigen/teichoic acid export membrane protein